MLYFDPTGVELSWKNFLPLVLGIVRIVDNHSLAAGAISGVFVAAAAILIAVTSVPVSGIVIAAAT